MSYASPAAVEQVIAWLKRERVRSNQAPSFNLTGSPAQIAVLRSLLAMSRTEFDDSDPGNLPVLIDPQTGSALPKDHPLTVAAAQAYLTQTTREEREAWFRVTCLNSRDGETIQKFSKVRSLIEHALRPKPSSGYTLNLNPGSGSSITCHACGSTSHNPNDVHYRFCGKCNLFHDDHR